MTKVTRFDTAKTQNTAEDQDEEDQDYVEKNIDEAVQADESENKGLADQLNSVLAKATPEQLSAMIDFLTGKTGHRQPASNPYGFSEKALFDPTIARKEVRAREKAEARASHLDRAPNGGVFMTAAGTYVNHDGKPCDASGNVKSNQAAIEE